MPFVPTDLNFFADAGLAWSSGQTPRLAFERELAQLEAGDRVPVTSVGASARINLLGYAVVELYYAWPFQRWAQQAACSRFQIARGGE